MSLLVFFHLFIVPVFSISSLVEDLSNRELKDRYDFLQTIDLNKPDYIISLMGDLEGTSMIVKIKNRDGQPLAVFKPSSGSTNHRGEYAMFKIGMLLGANIYPATIITELPVNKLKELLAKLEKTKFENKKFGHEHDLHFEKKEINRKIMIKQLKALIAKGQPLKGALKSWIPYLQFYKPLGTLIAFKSNSLTKYLQAEHEKPDHSPYELKQCTEILDPKGCYIGKVFVDDLVQDISSMMLIDAMLANNDRFPGGNVHFRALTDTIEQPNANTFVYPIARLLSLDNGSVFKDNTALKLLSELKICRFVKDHVERLKVINTSDLSLNPSEEKKLKANMKKVIAHIIQCHKKFGDKIWF